MAKTILFPSERAIGTVFVRPAGTPFTRGWNPLTDKNWIKAGPARGDVKIPDGQEILLRVDPAAQKIGESLSYLGPNLIQYLDLSKTKAKDADLEPIAEWQKLILVDLHETAVGDIGMVYLANVKGLRWINAAWCNAIGDNGITELGNLDALEVFFGAGPGVTDAALSVFKKFTETLIEIRLASPDITDSGMTPLHACTRLKDIHCPPGIGPSTVAALANAPLDTLVLFGCQQINDAAIATLAPIWRSMPTLTFIDLNATPITDAALPHLYPLTQLKFLHVINRTGLTPAGLESLATALPGCKFDH